MSAGDSGSRRARAPAVSRAGECADAIRADRNIADLWQQLDQSGLDPQCSIENLAGLAAGVLNIFPLEVARERLERTRQLDRAVDKFRRAVETYERQSGQRLPPPDPESDDGLDRYLAGLSEFLTGHERGMWVHPMVMTPAGQWPRTPESAVEVWVIRALDSTGIPRNTDAQRDLFLSLAVRVAELIAHYSPDGIETATTRKKIQNHTEFKGSGAMQWRG